MNDYYIINKHHDSSGSDSIRISARQIGSPWSVLWSAVANETTSWGNAARLNNMQMLLSPDGRLLLGLNNSLAAGTS